MGEERAAKMEAVRADGRQPFAARMRGLPEEEVIADFVETGRGPARGVMTELCRIDASGMLQLSPALAARCSNARRRRCKTYADHWPVACTQPNSCSAARCAVASPPCPS